MKHKNLLIAAFIFSLLSLIILPIKDGNIGSSDLTFGGAVLVLAPLGAILSVISLLKGNKLAWLSLITAVGAVTLLIVSGWSIQAGPPGI